MPRASSKKETTKSTASEKPTSGKSASNRKSTSVKSTAFRKYTSRESKASGNYTSMDFLRAASSKASSKEMDRIDHLFCSYANISSGMIDPDGIVSLCSDLGVDHTDVRILMLAWTLQAEKQGYFTLEEWRRGLKALRADTITKLQKAVLDLDRTVRKSSSFADFYSYAFNYCLTEEKQKSVDTESICILLDLVLGSPFRSQIDALIQYLKQQTDYKVINKDQWNGFYRFCKEIDFSTLENYDDTLAWPLILDNFVDWVKSKRGQA